MKDQITPKETSEHSFVCSTEARPAALDRTGDIVNEHTENKRT